MEDTLVMKFGGTSVGSVKAIQQVTEIVRKAKADWNHVAIVVSAMSGVTDKLLAGANGSVSGDTGIVEQLADEIREQHFTALEKLAPNASHERELILELLDYFVSLCQAIHVLGEASPRAMDAIASISSRVSQTTTIGLVVLRSIVANWWRK